MVTWAARRSGWRRKSTGQGLGTDGWSWKYPVPWQHWRLRVIPQNNTYSPCLLLVFRHRWNVLAGLSVQIHSKLIFGSLMGNFGQDSHGPPNQLDVLLSLPKRISCLSVGVWTFMYPLEPVQMIQSCRKDGAGSAMGVWSAQMHLFKASLSAGLT